MSLIELLKYKIKTVVTHFKRICKASQKLSQFQNNAGINIPKKLLQDIETRWNSTYYMLCQFVELQDAVQLLVALINKYLPVLTTDEWHICHELCQVLKSFEEVTWKLSGETYVTGSQIIF